MSGNSNLGYTTTPYLGGEYTNSNSNQYSGNFGSNETQKGGSWKKSVRRKIKNITRKYRKMAKKRSKSARKRMRSRYSKKLQGGWSYGKRRKSISRKQKGGQYTQFGSNITQPSGYTPDFNIRGVSALANPMSHTAGGVEPSNYNHYKYSAV